MIEARNPTERYGDKLTGRESGRASETKRKEQ